MNKPDIKLPEISPLTPNSHTKVSNFKARTLFFKERSQPIKRIIHKHQLPAKALVIGSGSRIHDNFIPAINTIKPKIEVIGLWSRTHAHASAAAELAGWPCLEELNASVLQNADVIFISISTSAVPKLLQNILSQADCSQKHLVVDTPVFSGLRQSVAARLLRKFASVTTTEDYMNFPPFHAMRKTVMEPHFGDVSSFFETAESDFGPVISVEIENIGYLYHGLALGRSFMNFPLIKKVERVSPQLLRYHVDDKRFISISTPYQQRTGSLKVVCQKGELSYFPATSEAHFQAIQQHSGNIVTDYWQDGQIQGIYQAINGTTHITKPRYFDELKSFSSCQDDDFNIFKTIGLIRVIESLYTHNVNSHYDYLNALYDNYVTQIAQKRGGTGLNYHWIMKHLKFIALF